MERQEIIVKVKLRLDELGPFEEGQVIDSGRISHFLDDSVKRLLLIIPPFFAKPSSFSVVDGTPVVATPFTDNKSGYIKLPDDFMRFVSLKMHSWNRSVTRAYTEDEPEGRMQSNPFLRGSISNPVCVFRTEPSEIDEAPYTTGKVLEYYSVLAGDHVIDRGLYLAATVAEDMDESLVDPLTWLVAESILNTVGEFDLAKAANAKVAEWINWRTSV